MQKINLSNTRILYILIFGILLIGSIFGIHIGSNGGSTLILAPVIGIPLLLITINKPWIAVAIFFLLIPLESLTILGGSHTATLTKLFGAYLAFLVIITGSIKYISEVFANKKVIWILLYGMVAIISLFLSRDTEWSISFLISLWLSIILYFILIMMIRDERSLNCIVIALLTGAVLSILSPFLFGYGRVTASIWERYGGLWGDQNEFAAILLVLLPLSILLFFTSKKGIMKIIAATYSVIIFTVLILTYSRGGFLALGLMAIMAMLKFISGKNRLRILAISIPCLIVVFIIFYHTFADEFISRMETLSILQNRESVRAEGSLDIRYFMYFELAPQLITEHPILGVGFRNFISYNPYNLVTHNTFLEVFTGMGIIGFIPFVLIIFFTWKELRMVGGKVIRDESDQYLSSFAKALELGFLSYMFAGLFISLDVSKMTWVCITLSAVALNISRIRDLYLYRMGKMIDAQPLSEARRPIFRRDNRLF